MERDALWRRVVDTRFGSMFIYLFIYFFGGGGGGVFGALSLEEYQIQDGVGQFSLFCHL